jgi:hypothetical protein
MERGLSAPPGSPGGLEEAKEKCSMDRNLIAEQMKLRSCIRSLIEEELSLREAINKLITEGEDSAPRQSTGLNVAEEVLRSVVPVLETGYKQMTTSLQQRESFKKHIINSLKYFILPKEIGNSIDSGTPQTTTPAPAIPEQGLEEQIPTEVSPKELEEVADPGTKMPLLGKPEDKKKEDETGFTDKEDDKVSPEQFAISGEDLTGRNVAYEVFKNIKAPIRKGYNKVQASPKDREIYTRAISANLLAHMDRFEQELQASPEALSTPDYTSATQQVGQTFRQG